MIPMATDTATLYMKLGNSWIRVALRGVVWSQKIVRSIGANGALQLARQTVLIIPAEISARIGDDAVIHVDPKVYATLTEDQRAGAWTLDKGFVIVRGEVTAEITDEYKISDLKAASDTYATIQTITDNTRRVALKHWQVEAV